MIALLVRFIQGLAVFLPLEALLPLRQRGRLFKYSRINDLLNCFGNALVWMVFFRIWSRLVPDALRWAKPYVLPVHVHGVLLIVCVLAVESFVYYWGHRLLHASPLLWRFHAVHHSIPDLDWLAGFRGHVFETAYFTSFIATAMYLLNLSKPVAYGFMIYRFFEGQIEHSNVRVPLGPLKWVVVNPIFHQWHHSLDAEARNKNYSSYPIWDVVFGTAFMPTGRVPEHFGTNAPVPEQYLGQLMYPIGLGDRAAQAQIRIEEWVRALMPSGKAAPEC